MSNITKNRTVREHRTVRSKTIIEYDFFTQYMTGCQLVNWNIFGAYVYRHNILIRSDMWWRSHFLLDARNLWRAFCVKCHEGDANNWQYCCCISKNEEKGWADIHYYTYTINISMLKSGKNKNLKKKKNQHFLTNGGHRHFWQIWIQRHLKPLWLIRTTLA